MNISERGLKLIEEFEGFSAVRYNDGTGVMTIGFGTTSADGPLPARVTRAQAEALLRNNLRRRYEPAINGLGIPLNQNQYDALCSLAYNCGPGIVSDAYQIGRDLRARNYAAAAEDFLHYEFAGGRRLQGLVNRREAEKRLFLTPVAAPKPTLRDPIGEWRFTGHVDMGNGQWHIQPAAGTNIQMGEHARRWAAEISVDERNGSWEVKGLPFVEVK